MRNHQQTLGLPRSQAASPQYPRITIVIPSYNYGQYLEACLDSILSQNYPNLELIVMDGGSTDNTVEILKRHEKHLYYWQSRPDAGQYSAIEAGFQRSTSEIMAWLNADDMFHPGAFSTVAAIFSENQEVEWLMGRPNSFDEPGNQKHVLSFLPMNSRAKYLADEELIQQEGVFWRRGLWERSGAYIDKELLLAADLELWARFFRSARLFSVDTLIAGFRDHPMQKSKDKAGYTAEANLVLARERQIYAAEASPFTPAAPLPILVPGDGHSEPQPIRSHQISNKSQCGARCTGSLHAQAHPKKQMEGNIMLAKNNEIRIALISADLGNFRNNLTTSYVKQDIPDGFSLDIFFFDDNNFTPRPSLSPRLQSKIPKMLGYELAPGYDFYIWIDSSFILSHKDSVSWFLKSCENFDMVVFKHPHRKSISEELNYILRSIESGDKYLTGRYESEPIQEQVNLYSADKDFIDDSLYACGAFIYRKELLMHQDNILPLWFYHNARYSIQDQLSFPYLANRLKSSGGCKVGEFAEGIFSNPYIKYCDPSNKADIKSNVGKWDDWYKDLPSTPGPFKYSDTITYELGCKFLNDCFVVEDWGTGAGGFKRFRPDAIGVDGSNTPHADKKFVDLVTYTSTCDAIFMRHVLEHNFDWVSILRNALRSASKKICLVIFTPINEVGSKEIAHNLMHGVDVPDLSLGHNELYGVFEEFGLKKVGMEQIASATGYGVEYIFYLEK